MSLMPKRCPRCGRDDIAYSMSMYNTQMICMNCIKQEGERPDYLKAVERENEEVKKGNYNYEGIGL